MGAPTAPEILHLCDRYEAEVIRPNGVEPWAPSSEQYRLRKNGIHFHELSWDQAVAACVGLSVTLSPKGRGAYLDLEHFVFWGWAAQIFLCGQANEPFPSRHRLRTFGQTLFSLVLADAALGSPLAGEAPAATFDWHARRVLNDRFLLLKYLSFPYLEALLRYRCKQYITETGQVLLAFSAVLKSGKPRRYRVGDRCNDVGALLQLWHFDSTDIVMRGAIGRVKRHLSEQNSTIDPFLVVGGWRNASLHGEVQLRGIGGAILNLIVLVALDLLQSNYPDVRDEAWATVRHVLSRFPHGSSPWLYYRPSW